MKPLCGAITLLLCIACHHKQADIEHRPWVNGSKEGLILKADLVSSYSNFSNPRDRNYYYLVDVRLMNKTNRDFEFYTLICGSLVNIVTDSRQMTFLYHNCTADLAALIRLKPEQEYCVKAILLRNKYVNTFNPNIRMGFVISKPKPGPLTNHEIVAELKSLREKQENVIWSEPLIFTATNSYSYQIRNIINDSTYSLNQ